MKLNRFVVLAIIVALMNGCAQPMGGPFDVFGQWNICNQTPYEFEVQLKYEQYMFEKEAICVMEPQSTKVIVEDYGGLFFESSYAYREEVVFSFVFANGVVHTFDGDMIEHDVRDVDSWAVVLSEDKYNRTHTYTFTNDDYERIMALHTNNAN